MFINLGSEYILVSDQDSSIQLPFRDVEYALTEWMVSSYKKHLPDKIYVLNGPGSFTNLRVGCLSINTLSFLTKSAIKIFTIDKLSLYRILFEHHILPRYGYIFMGQRKNMWYYDFQTTNYQVLPLTTLTSSDFDYGQDGDFFVDTIIGEDFTMFHNHPRQLKILFTQDALSVYYGDHNYDIVDYFSLTEKMEPYYAMEPNIG